MGGFISSNSKQDDKARVMMEDLKSVEETLQQATGKVSEVIRRVEQEQDILGSASQVLSNIEKDVKDNLLPGLCYRCTGIVRKHIGAYKTERMKILDRERHLSHKEKYLRKTNDEGRDVYRGPQNTSKKCESDAKFEELRSEKAKLESKVSLLSSQLEEANELKRKSDLGRDEMEASLTTVEKQLEKIKEQSDDMKKENEEMKTKLRKLEFEVKTANTHLSQKELDWNDRLDSEKLENNNLIARLDKLEKSNSELKNEVSEKDKHVEHLHRENETLHKQIHELSTQKEHKERDNAELVSELHDSKKENRELRTILNETLDKNSKQESSLKDLDTKVRNLQEQEVNMLKEHRDLTSKLECSENLYKKAMRDIDEMSDKNIRLESSSKELETTVHNLRQEGDALLKEQMESTRKLEHTENLLKNALRDIKLKNEELEKFKKAKPPLVIGVRTLGSGLHQTISNMIVSELTRLIRGSFKSDNIKFDIKQCTSPSDVPNGPLIVLCLTQTRIGSNVKEALDGIEASRDVIILVLHHKEQEHTSSIYPTKSRIGGDYPKVGDILDMVFLDQRGIYDCDFNAETLHNLTNILSKYISRL